jgi:hypothetical protein
MKRKAALICPIKDETTYIDKFFEYYSRHFESRDIYILDFGSNEDYLKNKIGNKANIIKTDANILDAIELFNALRALQTRLYEDYVYSIPVDVDEFLVYNKPGGLKKYLNETETEIATCVGQEVIHLPFIHPDLDLNDKWIYQLKYWYPNIQHYGKTLICKHELEWESGFHTYIGEDYPQRSTTTDENLFLIHMHKHDFKTTINRHKTWSDFEWSKKSIEDNHNHHYRQTEIEVIEKWYYDPMFKGIYEIPETIKKSLNI